MVTSILVGHSYGGMVITEAGNASNVAGLVIAAFQPDAGETLSACGEGSRDDRESARRRTSSATYLDPKVYANDFAADRTAGRRYEFMWRRGYSPPGGFDTKIKEAGWRAKKSWSSRPNGRSRDSSISCE